MTLHRGTDIKGCNSPFETVLDCSWLCCDCTTMESSSFSVGPFFSSFHKSELCAVLKALPSSHFCPAPFWRSLVGCSSRGTHAHPSPYEAQLLNQRICPGDPVVGTWAGYLFYKVAHRCSKQCVGMTEKRILHVHLCHSPRILNSPVHFPKGDGF